MWSKVICFPAFSTFKRFRKGNISLQILNHRKEHKLQKKFHYWNHWINFSNYLFEKTCDSYISQQWWLNHHFLHSRVFSKTFTNHCTFFVWKTTQRNQYYYIKQNFLVLIKLNNISKQEKKKSLSCKFELWSWTKENGASFSQKAQNLKLSKNSAFSVAGFLYGVAGVYNVFIVEICVAKLVSQGDSLISVTSISINVIVAANISIHIIFCNIVEIFSQVSTEHLRRIEPTDAIAKVPLLFALP